MKFALSRLRKTPRVRNHQELLRSGEAMEEFLDTFKGMGIKVPEDKIQRLFDLMKQHLVLAEDAGIHYVPKHHFCAHLAERTCLKQASLGFCVLGAGEGRCKGGGGLCTAALLY
eukprot:707196-Pyramimonas_sp.AAC.1